MDVTETKFLKTIFRTSKIWKNRKIWPFTSIFLYLQAQVIFLNFYKVHETTSQQSCRFFEQCWVLDCASSVICHNSADTCIEEHHFSLLCFHLMAKNHFILLDFKMDFSWLVSQAPFCWLKVFWEELVIFCFRKLYIIDKLPLKVIFKYRIQVSLLKWLNID